MKHISFLKQLSKKTILISWIISYSLVFVLSLCCNMFTYNQCKKTLTKQIKSSDERSIQMVAQNIDSLISSVSSIANTISSSLDLSTYQNSIEMPGNTYGSAAFSSFLKKQIVLVPQVDMIYCRFNGSDTIVSNVALLSSSDFFDVYCKDVFADKAAWFEALDKFNYCSYYHSDEYIHIYYTLPLKQFDGSSATLGFVINKDTLYKFANQFLPLEERNFYIIDKQSTPVLSRQSFDKEPPSYESVEYLKNQSDLPTCFSASAVNSWIYIVETPDTITSTKLRSILFAIICIIILELVLGVFVVTLFVNKNYRKLMKVVQPARKLLSDDIGDFNEYEILETLTDNYKEFKNEYRVMQMTKSVMDKSRFLSAVLRGECGINLFEITKKYGIEFDCKYFYVVMLTAIESDEYILTYKDGGNAAGADNTDITVFIISNVMQELFAPFGNVYSVDIDGFIYFIINTDCENTVFANKITGCLNYAKNFLKQNFMLSFSVIVSDRRTGIVGISEAYCEVMDTRKHYSFLDINDDKIVFTNAFKFPVGQTEKLKNMLEQVFEFAVSSKEKATLSLFESALNETKKQKSLILVHAFVLHFCSESTKALLKITDENNISKITKLMNKMMKISQTNLLNTTSADEMREILHDITVMSAAYAENLNKPEIKSDNMTHSSIALDIRQFINKHFYRPDLFLSTIGDYFGKTPYYLSNCFKSAEGISIMDYISMLRVEAAKEIMRDFDISIEQIAVSVGFGNTRNFNRAFKKYEGISPSQYKKKFK